jgi:LacI family transcriptional regulator
MKEKLTILDIARLAGVSKSTVSRVLNQQARVDDETRKRVLRVIEEYNFAPSLNAKGLKGQSQLIGMLVPALTWPIIMEIIQGIAQVVERSTYEIILYNFSTHKDFNKVLDQIVATRLSAGLLVMLHTQSPAHLIELHQQGIPVVLVNTVGLRTNLPLVVADNYGGSYQGVQHLIKLGHRRIGYINGAPEFPCCDERYRGYCDALRDAGISLDPVLFQQGQFDIITGRQCAETLLNLEEPPTAIFTASDEMAYGVMDVAKVRGLRVPEDLSVVGFNDDVPSANTHPALTTIRQPFRDMGQYAAELLLSLLDSQYPFSEEQKKFAIDYRAESDDSLEKDGEVPIQIQLPAPLIVRASCSVVSPVSSRPAFL